MEIFSLDFIREILNHAHLKTTLIQITILLLVAISLDIFQRRTVKKISEKIENKDHRFVYIKSILKTIRLPISIFIYIMSVTVALDLFNQITEIALIDKFIRLRGIALTLCIGYFCMQFVKQLKIEMLKDIDKAGSGDKTGVQIYSNIAVVFVFVLFGMMILQELGLSVSGLMAFGGIGGLIVGLSAKELLSDFFGGLVLMTDKPFKVGDWICSPDRDIEGTVEEIGMRRICVRTFDKRPLYIPNSIMSTITIENPSRMTNRRIFETIGVRYEDADKVSAITRKVKDMLEKHTGIDATQTLMVNVNAFGSHSVDFFVYTFTKTTDWTTYHGIKHNILLNIYDIIKEEGADIAFPTSIVHLEKEKHTETMLEHLKSEMR